MGMGIVSDNEFNKEFTKLTGLTIETNVVHIPEIIKDNKEEPRDSEQTGVIEDVPTRGRGEGSTEVPNSVRKLIGDESVANGRQSAIELAESFGISPSSVSAYNVGATSTSSYEDRPNAGTIRRTKERIAKRARGKLFLALSKITEDKLDAANIKDLAAVAMNMSVIAKNSEPSEEHQPKDNRSAGPTFVFYAPQSRREDTFDTINVKD